MPALALPRVAASRGTRTGKGNAALRSGAPGAGRAERAGRTGNGRKRAARGPLAPGPGQAETDSFIQALDVLDPTARIVLPASSDGHGSPPSQGLQRGLCKNGE